MRNRRRHQRGQSAVVALLVLLLLSFVGALFITIIARNLETQGRTHRTLNADYYAEAGLRYADDQLTTSLDGADWRPPLQYQLLNQPTDPNGLKRYNAIKTTLIDGTVAPYKSDPDLTYLQQGFVRYNTQNGRFLLRVTYDPVLGSSTTDPTARYLKIESIGREGVVKPDDPTTFQNQPPTRLAATLVAYKPIGITDYSRFETDIDQRSGTANLGVPSLYHTNNGSNDATPNGIVTPGVFDFNINQANSSAPLSLQQYPIIMTLGAPNAYMTLNGNTTGTVYPNPYAGQVSYSSGTATPKVPSGYTAVPGGGTLRANMDLRLFGENVAYLNTVPNTTVQDDIEIAGRLLLDNYQPTNNANNLSGGQQAALILNNITNPTETDYVAPTNGYDPIQQVGTPFSTHNGVVRDGGTGGNASDANGDPRSIARLDPPVIDSTSSATHLTRYQAITQNSFPRLDPATVQPNQPYSGMPYPLTLPDGNPPGLDGYGRSIYVNNVSDVQRDSTSLVGGHTLVDEWLNANPGGQGPTTSKGGWVGPFYNPPGAEIVFGPQPVTVGSGATAQSAFQYGFRITRSDVDSSGNPVLWLNPGGAPTPTMVVTYDQLYASNDPTVNPSSISGNQLASYQANPNNDVLIYLEGNVRLRGIISAPSSATADDAYPRHVTVITNGTAYIDGNLLKGNPDSSITVLARDYVCVNTTQLLAGAAQTYPSVSNGLLTFQADSDQFVQEFSFGLQPSAAYSEAGANGTSAPLSPLSLYVSGGGGSGSVTADFDITNPLILTTPQNLPEGIKSGAMPGNPFDSPVLGLGLGLFDSSNPTPGNPASLIHRSYSLYDLLGANLYATFVSSPPTQPWQLWVRRDPGSDAGANPAATSYSPDQPFQLERVAILPMDIRIEAVLYAQNKSFFVIPGPWFNSDGSDTVDQFYSNGVRQGFVNPTAEFARYPFYGQPLDLKITVVGSVSEARPADIGAQTAWMQKWGWIPKYHGSEYQVMTSTGTQPGFEPAGHTLMQTNAAGQNVTLPAVGLSLIYDPMDGYPFDAANGGVYLRTDLYGRPLPVTPKLPVSTGLLYAGQNTGQTLP